VVMSSADEGKLERPFIRSDGRAGHIRENSSLVISLRFTLNVDAIFSRALY